MKRHCTYMYFVIIGYGGEYERVIVDRWPRFCMKEKRSSRNSFLFGSGDMSYSCTLTHIITLSSKQTNRTKVNLTCSNLITICQQPSLRCSQRRQTSSPVPSPGELDETYIVDSGYSHHYMKSWRHPRNRKYITYRIAVRGGPSHGYG